MPSPHRLLAISLALVAPACMPPMSPHEAAEHDEAPDPRLEEPAVVAASRSVKVLPGALDCSTEVLGLVDVHEKVKDTDQALDLLRRRAAILGADAVVGVEFEHGEGGAEKTHLSGTAVRCNDLLHGRRYEVITKLEVLGEMEREDDALAQFKAKARAAGANLILDVHFEHGEGDRTKITGTAVRAYEPTAASR